MMQYMYCMSIRKILIVHRFCWSYKCLWAYKNIMKYINIYNFNVRSPSISTPKLSISGNCVSLFRCMVKDWQLCESIAYVMKGIHSALPSSSSHLHLLPLLFYCFKNNPSFLLPRLVFRLRSLQLSPQGEGDIEPLPLTTSALPFLHSIGHPASMDIT